MHSNMEFGKDSLLSSRCLLLGTTLLSFFKGVSADYCPSDFPFDYCPRPLDTPDDILCCVIDDYDYECCSQSILTLWWVIVLCCGLLLVILVLTVVLCCCCPCCLCAAARRQSRQSQTTPASQEVIVNPPLPTEQPPSYSYSLQPYPAVAPAIPTKGLSGDPASLPLKVV